VAVDIERMKQTEWQRVSAQRIRRMNGSVQSSKGLTKVVVQGYDGKDIGLVDKNAIGKSTIGCLYVDAYTCK